MDKHDIKRLKELAEKATPGPWQAEQYTGEIVTSDRRVAATQNGGMIQVYDCQLIAAMRNALPALLAAYEDAERMRAALNHQRSALALVRDRQCHDGICTIAIADLEQGIRQIDAAMGDKL